MPKQLPSRFVYQVTYAFRGLLISTCIGSIAFMLIVIRGFMGALDANDKTVFDSAYTVYGIPILGFGSLSIVLMLLGWKKGKEVSNPQPEQGHSDESHLGLTISTGVLFLITCFLIYNVIQLVTGPLSR